MQIYIYIYKDIHVMILNDEYEDKYGQMSMKKNEKYHYLL